MISFPPPFVHVKFDIGFSEFTQSNNDCLIWKCFDQLLMSWLLASISEEIFSNMANYVTTNEIWESLQNYFISESMVRIVNLKNSLQTFKKGSFSIQEFVRRMKDMYDTLVAYG